MVYKDNPEETYSRVNGNDNDDDDKDMSTSLEISHPMNSISENNTIQTRSYKEICMLTCFICVCAVLGYMGGLMINGGNEIKDLPLLNALDFSGHTNDDDSTDPSTHMRASAASMTEATAKDIAANKVIDNSNRFDDIPDLSRLWVKLNLREKVLQRHMAVLAHKLRQRQQLTIYFCYS